MVTTVQPPGSSSPPAIRRAYPDDGGPTMPPPPPPPPSRGATLVGLGVAFVVLVVAAVLFALVALALLWLDRGVPIEPSDPWTGAPQQLEELGLLEPGARVDVVVEGQTAVRFAVSSEQLLRLELDGTDGPPDLDLELLGARGQPLSWRSTADVGASDTARSAPQLFLLPSGGSYELLVLPYGSAIDAVTMTATVHDLGTTTTVIDLDGDEAVGGQDARVAFEASAGQVAIVTMRAVGTGGWSDVDPAVWLYAADGTELGYDDDGGGELDAQLLVELPSDGRYEVEASTFEGRTPPTGTFTLSVELVDIGQP